MADSTVDTALLPVDIRMRNDDWNGIQTPVLLRRNFTILGTADYPVTLDLNFVKAKAQLANGTSLAFRRVVLVNIRTGSLNQAPGLDLLLPPPPPGAQALLWIDAGGLHYRACFPLAVAL
ncbi:hypothetical protein GPECTOR_37g202 [Gonium pectorale]|uniref:Uncharacterized protein n=1 Tax=Gonium pectorale TaxID=33097 RepID=A0A150GBH5_GONPE|nr:hypothetical protein GPECTOR_37g202 [Gonium pectorale]|eukprot:KXZ47196.1 hypothetical protein GPECTOR_37g202 [Gonium pectorale]